MPKNKRERKVPSKNKQKWKCQWNFLKVVILIKPSLFKLQEMKHWQAGHKYGPKEVIQVIFKTITIPANKIKVKK